MSTKLLLLTFLITSIFTFNTSAQKIKDATPNIISLKGKVIEKGTTQALEYATIVLTPTNGKEISGGTTDSSGNFDFKVKKGTYNISIEYISFNSKKILNKELSQNTDLGTIALEINTQLLKEVEIVGKKSSVEIRLDKKIYNVGSDMTVKGGTASDVLDNVPSVSVDVEGNVSLRGNSNVRILINGKPSGLVGLSSTDALRQLPADAIEKVEVVTSPSARYDAEGTAGILNIILRKDKAIGLNASVTGTGGNPDYYGGTLNLNFRSKKINFFTTSSYNYRKAPGNSQNYVTYFDDQKIILSYRNDIRIYDRKNNNSNPQFGVEYSFSDKSSLTGTILYRYSDSDNISTNNIFELDKSYALTSRDERIENATRVEKTLEYSLNFTQNFKTEGHKLTFDFQYGISSDNNLSQISDRTIFPTIIENNPERTSTDQSSKYVLIQGDYVLPFDKNSQFEFGFKGDLSKENSVYLVEDYQAPGKFVKNLDFSNSLDFKQNIYAFYSQYGNKINKFSYLLGLRMELTDLNIGLTETNLNFDKKYAQLFPTVNLGLEFSESESLTLGYSRRIRRPRSWFLNPFESRLSETYILTGNVDLDPSYSNAYDLGYLKRWDKLTLNSSIYYQYDINNFEFTQTEETRILNNVPTLVVIRKPVNLSSQQRFGFELTLNYNLLKWWKLSNNFNFFKFITRGEYNNVNYYSNNVSWFNRLNSRISLSKKIDFQTIATYNAPIKSAQSTREGIIYVNMALSKDILKGKGTLSLNVNDLLNSRKRKSTDYSPTTVSNSEFQWRERQILLNFTYRFNQKKKNEKPMQNFDSGGEGEM